jgi:acetyl esterase/lipase
MKKILLVAGCLLSIHSMVAQSGDYGLVNNVAYRQGANDSYAVERCKMDIYYPEGATGFPTVVWFHGGGLSGGEKFIPQQLKQAGLAVVAVNYRLLPKAQLTDCIDDAAAAVAWTFNEISKYGGDTQKIFVAGHSAGGYLATLIGLDKKWLARYGIDADLIAGLIPFSGQAITHYAYRQSKGMKDTQPEIDEFAPLYYVRADAPPLVIVSGDREMELLGRYEENAYFWRMMKVAGHKVVYLYELDGYDHGAMADPAFHILKNHIKDILKKKADQ